MNEIQYKRELNHSYMVIPCGNRDISESYAWRMMTENHIGKLLDCTQRCLNGETFYYYDITSRQPLERLYESRKLNVENLREILYATAAMQEDLGEYLLDEQGLMLESGMIFADVETEELYFCFHPEKKDSGCCYEKLADFFLGHVDHGDEHAVNIAYQFYKMSKSAYFVISSFLPFLEKEIASGRQENELYNDSGREYEELADFAESTEPVEEETREWKKEKKGWFWRIFGRKRNRKREDEPVESRMEAVWDTYEGQIDFIQTGETVYFSDLDKPCKEKKGIPCLTEEGGDRQFCLENLPLTVGKLKGRVSIVLTDHSVSRMHARLESLGGEICVMDLNSRNGTVINGKKLSPNESAALYEGDLVQFGRERFRYGFIDSNALK